LTNEPGRPRCSLNIELQRELNPPRESRIERLGWTFCPGDQVIRVENDYDQDVYNGGSVLYPASIWRTASSSPISMAAKSPTALANSTRAQSGGSDKQGRQ
jgi:hypothetical protein